MKKLILSVVAAFAMIAGYNMYQSNSKTDGMSELMFANVEALAAGESDGICRTNIDYTAYCNYYDIWDPCPCGF